MNAPHGIQRLLHHEAARLKMSDTVLVADDAIGRRCREKMITAWKTLDRVNILAIREAIDELKKVETPQ